MAPSIEDHFDLDFVEATRNPFDVIAVEVTFENIEQLAKWCGGEISTATYRIAGTKAKLPCVKLPAGGKLTGETITALIGHWVIKHDDTFRVFRSEIWRKQFTVKAGVTVAEMKAERPSIELIDNHMCSPVVPESKIEQGSVVRVITKIGGYFGLVGLVMSIDSEDVVRVAFIDIEEPGQFMRWDLELTNDPPQ